MKRLISTAAAVSVFMLPVLLAADDWEARLNNAVLNARDRPFIVRKASHVDNPFVKQLQEALEHLAEETSRGVVRVVVSSKRRAPDGGEGIVPDADAIFGAKLEGHSFAASEKPEAPAPQAPDQNQIVEAGSGFIIDNRGERLVVTNAHVVQAVGAGGQVMIVVGDKTGMAGVVLGYNVSYDLALVRMEQSCGSCAALELGDSDDLHEMQFVMAAGAPFGLTQTKTFGVISHLKRGGLTNGLVDDYIQTDAVINPGSSGGPLVDMNGRVIGVNTSIVSPKQVGFIGIGLAAPIRHVKEMIERYNETGAIGSSWIGAQVFLNRDKEIVVEEVAKESPAEEAGLKKGDVILAIDGRSAPLSATGFMAAIANKAPSKAVTLLVRREEQGLFLRVVPEAIQNLSPRCRLQSCANTSARSLVGATLR